MSKLFIVGASDFQLPAILKAKEMGLDVAVADYNPEAIGISYADKYYNVSTNDEAGICEAAKDFDADGIITLCTDMPMRAVAYTCEKLGLRGLPYNSAISATDKIQMIKTFEEYGVAHPKFIALGNDEDLDRDSFDLTFPVISKPTDSSGGRGVKISNSIEELERAIEYSSSKGRKGNVIIEECMVGPETSVEILVLKGEPHVLQITDKETSGAPYFVEIGHSQPSRLSEEAKEQIAELARKAVKSIGIIDGTAHAEIMYTSEGPKMVEIGARMGGGCISTHLVPLSTGFDMTKAQIDVALGNDVDLTHNISRGSAIRFILPKEGTITSIEGIEEAKTIPGVELVEVQCEVGQNTNNLIDGTCRLGYVIASADTAEEAVDICELAISKINIKFE